MRAMLPHLPRSPFASRLKQFGATARTVLAVLSLSAAGLVGIAVSEGYSERAYPDPVHGTKVPTIGFGTTQGVQMGDTTTPVKALQRKLTDVQSFEGALKRCVKVPLHQHEYDAYVSLAYKVMAARGLKVSRIARGLPVGGELEYSDAATVAQALRERRDFV